MTLAKPAALSLLTLAISQAASAQVAAPAPAAAPVEAWSAQASADRPIVQIRKTATDGRTLFVGGCDGQRKAGVNGSFLRYTGPDLKQIDGQTERTLFEIRGAEWKEVFAVSLRYSAGTRTWQIADTLAPVFLNSFSRGATLTVLNSQRKAVVSFDLTGSTAATKTMRDTCGFA